MPPISLVIIGSRDSVAASCMTLAGHNAIKVVACLYDTAEHFTELIDTEPMIALIDFSVLSDSEYGLLVEFRRFYPKTKVILLCDNADQAKVIEAFRYGAVGYVEVRDRDMFLVRAIRAVNDGEVWIPRQYIGTIVERLL